MRPDRVLNPGPLTLESDVVPTALPGPDYRFCSLKVPISMALLKKHYRRLKTEL